MAYHSGTKHGRVEDADPLEKFEYGNSVAFRYDIFDPYPSIYSECDVIYGEPPWRAGSKVFDERLGIVGRQFTQLTKRLSNLIAEVDIPVIMVCGTWGEDLLPKPDEMAKAFIKGAIGDCFIYTYRTGMPEITPDIGPLPAITQKYNVIGDWFCGYGNTALAAIKANKRFIISDYDPRCIGFIKKSLND